MFNGKSKIELFDGITGKKKDEHINENRVTQALANMFGIDSAMLAAGIRAHEIIDRMTPIYPAYVRGIMLWENNLPDDGDCVFAQPGNKCIGHAGSEYAGAKETRGTFNRNETVNIPNGVRMVWDFGTDKANGQFRALSLTSIYGGDAGWLTPPEAGIYNIARLTSNQAYSNNSPALIPFAPPSVAEPGHFIYVGELRKGVYSWISENGSNIRVLEQTFTNPTAIGMHNKAGALDRAHATERVYVMNSDAPFPNFNRSWIIDENNRFVVTSLVGTGMRNMRVRFFDLTTKQQTGQRNITLDRDTFLHSGITAFYKNELYTAMPDNKISKFSADGVYIGDVQGSHTLGEVFSTAAGMLFASQANGAWSVAINDGVTSTRGVNGNLADSAHASRYNNMTSLKPPLITADNNICFITPYLATVNNLNSAVNKSSTDTMKITYDLTQA
jgi:hypothetical protein